LAIAGRLAHLLGSRIEVTSRPGKGSVFAVEVPRGQRPTAAALAAPGVRLADSLGGRLVLIVDDDALVRDAVGSLLAQWGCEVALAANGDGAVATLAQLDRVPDALLCDYRLAGGETGIEVMRRLHTAAGIEIPAALVSGDTAPESLREAKASGYPVLPKPVAPAKLRALIEHLAAASPPRRGPAEGEGQGLVG
jgi:CheY-like chemotaxis protein